MSASRNLVTIKGVKDGLVFLFNDTCSFAELCSELLHKLEKTHQKILSGPLIHVHVKLGKRMVSDEEKAQIRALISAKGNLIIQSIESAEPEGMADDHHKNAMKIIQGIIRSGQTFRHEGDLMLMGDVNPGGTILSTGDIIIMGSLRGLAHAGIDGNEDAIIAASYLKPTQLRIANIISRPPDEWGIEEAFMEFAYIKNGQMEIDKINQIQRIRPEKDKIASYN
jgi:septum site-determining protein MinC